MIVLAIIGLVMGVLVGPRVIRSFNEAKLKTTFMMTKEYESAFAKWTTENEGQACPDKIEDLVKYVNSSKTDTNDSWGHKFVMKCGDAAPPDQPFGVVSFGPDGKEGTADDIKSWDAKSATPK